MSVPSMRSFLRLRASSLCNRSALSPSTLFPSIAFTQKSPLTRLFSSNAPAESGPQSLVAPFLASIGAEEHADKFPTFHDLIHTDSATLKSLDIKIKPRKKILAAIESYKQRDRLNRCRQLVDRETEHPTMDAQELQRALYAILYEHVIAKTHRRAEIQEKRRLFTIKQNFKNQHHRDHHNELMGLFNDKAWSAVQDPKKVFLHHMQETFEYQTEKHLDDVEKQMDDYITIAKGGKPRRKTALEELGLQEEDVNYEEDLDEYEEEDEDLEADAEGRELSEGEVEEDLEEELDDAAMMKKEWGLELAEGEEEQWSEEDDEEIVPDKDSERELEEAFFEKK